ncbi:MAG: hypothetical protein GXO23_00850 [Crenarchaeota archaeon]|nr:hypothetical protein [Thermoproteota archaeon]
MFFLLILNSLIGLIPIVPVVLLSVFGYFSISRALRNIRNRDISMFRKALSILYFISLGEVVLYIIEYSLRGAYITNLRVMVYVSTLLALSTSAFLSVQYYLVDRCVEEMYSHHVDARWNISYICLELVSLAAVSLLVSYAFPVLVQIIVLNLLFMSLHLTYVRARLLK